MPRERRLQASDSRAFLDEQGAELGEVIDDTIIQYCRLDPRIQYEDRKKLDRFLCVCGQPCESMPEIRAHINNPVRAACRYIIEKVAPVFEDFKGKYDQASGQLATCLVKSVCEEAQIPVITLRLSKPYTSQRSSSSMRHPSDRVSSSSDSETAASSAVSSESSPARSKYEDTSSAQHNLPHQQRLCSVSSPGPSGLKRRLTSAQLPSTPAQPLKRSKRSEAHSSEVIDLLDSEDDGCVETPNNADQIKITALETDLLRTRNELQQKTSDELVTQDRCRALGQQVQDLESKLAMKARELKLTQLQLENGMKYQQHASEWKQQAVELKAVFTMKMGKVIDELLYGKPVQGKAALVQHVLRFMNIDMDKLDFSTPGLAMASLERCLPFRQRKVPKTVPVHEKLSQDVLWSRLKIYIQDWTNQQ